MLDYTGSTASFSVVASRRYSNGRIAWRGFWITEVPDCGGSVIFCSGFVCDLPDRVSLCVYLSVLCTTFVVCVCVCVVCLRSCDHRPYRVLCTLHVELV